MTILFIIPSITNYFTFLEDIAAELESQGHKVILATSTEHISEIDCYDRPIHGELIEVEFPRGIEFSKHLKAAKRLRNIVSERSPNIIYVHFSAALFTTAIAKRSDWPITIGMMHGMAFPILKGWRKAIVGPAERWAARNMDMVMLLNQADKEKLGQFMDPELIYVTKSFGLGCDLEKFSQETISEETKTRFHRRLSAREEDFVFIFVGRQVNFKGFDKLIRAFLNLFEDHKNLKLILVGDRDNIHSTNLSKAETERMRRCPGIINVGWKENVHEYLTVADVNVFPSMREGMPVNLMESLAMGVPVIATDTRGCHDVVDHEVTGLLVEDNSVARIQSAMYELYTDRDKLRSFSGNALKQRSKFERKLFIQEQLAIFDHLEKGGSVEELTNGEMR